MEGSWPNLLTTQDSEENHQAKNCGVCKLNVQTGGLWGAWVWGCMVGKLETSSFFCECFGVPQALFCLETDGAGCVLGLNFDEVHR